MRSSTSPHHYDDEMAVFPGCLGHRFVRTRRSHATDAMTEHHMLNHIGTHVDAPAHQILDGDTLDDIGVLPA